MSVINVNADELTEALKKEPLTGGGDFIMGNASDISMFTTGPGGIAPGIMFTMDNGDRFAFTFATDKPIAELHAAMAAHMSGMAKRLGSMFIQLHEPDVLGCKATHALFNKASEDANQTTIAKVGSLIPDKSKH